MRFSSQPFQRTLSYTAGVTTPNVSMRPSSSNGRGRGNLWRRGFCDRPLEPPPPDVEFVSGDSHLRAVSAVNYAHRSGYDSGPVPRRPPYPTNGPSTQLRPLPQARFRPSPQRFWTPPNNDNNSGGFYPAPPPGWRHPQFGVLPPGGSRHDSQGFPQAGGYHQANSGFLFRPSYGFRPHQGWRPPSRIRPADFREWVSSSTQLPPQAERLKVLSYNILADYLARDHRDRLYFHIPQHVLDWEWRKRKILIEFGLWSPDILCLQEVDRFQDLEQELLSRGYHGIWKMRTGNASDGCATFWRANRFELLNEESIEFNKLGLRDNVAQICVFEIKAVSKGGADSGSESLPSGFIPSTEANRVVICNIHVLYNPKRGEIKLGQVRTLIDRAYSVSRQWNNAPVILCGDFNSTPKSPLYNFISMQKLDLSGLTRDKISGQYSSALPLPNAPFVSGYHWSGSSTKSYDLKEVHFEQELKGESREPILSSTSPAHCPQGFGVMTESNFSHQSGNEECPESPIIKTRTDLGGSISNYITSISDEKLVLDQPRQCDQLDASSGACASDSINKQEAVVEEKSYIVASFEGIGSSHEINVKDNEIKSSISSRILAVELSDLNLDNGDGTECIVADIHCNAEKLDLVSSKLFKESNQTSLIAMESISRSEAYMSCSDKDSVLAHGGMNTNSAGNKSCAKMQEWIADCNPENIDGTEEDDGATLLASQSDENFDLNFLAELHGTKSLSELTDNHAASSNGNYGASWDQLNAGFQNHVHDPFSWTTIESEIASGNKDCTLLQHNLRLKSAYATVGDPTGTKDSGGEPQVTSYNRQFMGTVDYIWFSDGLQAVKVLGTIPKDVLQKSRGFPTAKWGSDHIAIVCELAFCGD